jgi:hypothetical protein
MEEKQHWNYALDYYEKLIEEGFDFAPQLKIVKKIVDSDYAESLFPTLSHFALCISRIEDFHKSLDYPSICLEYVGEENFFVTYSPEKKQTHNLSKNKVYLQNTWSYLESLFLKQKIETGL